MAQWSERSPFTSEVTGWILSENFLMQCYSSPVLYSCEKSQPKVVAGFLWALPFPPTGKLTGWVRINTDREVKISIVVKIASSG